MKMQMKKLIKVTAASLLYLLPLASCAEIPQDKQLEGTWIETEAIGDYPRTVLHFENSRLRIENMYDKTVVTDYAIRDIQGEEFAVSYEFIHKVKRANGRIIDRKEQGVLFFHTQDGLSILSQDVFEYDGRGRIFFGEFLKKDDFRDGFVSDMKKRLNSAPAVSTMMRME
ncbi:MAG: hypothetical protein IJ523_02745 [Succinivibrionaceae bacterium]|nr:hypothetical protein [Succinivibrionaceae bacterium]